MDNYNLYSWLKNEVAKSLYNNFGLDNFDHTSVVIEVPKQKEHGDLSTNIAMVLAKNLSKNPREIAEILVNDLSKNNNIDSVSVAGPGFLNFKFTNDFWSKILQEIINSGENYGKSNIGENIKVNLEFVSANPTGPLHIGHARGAVYGDALARIMEYCNYEVCREYYVNDAGGQIEVLAKSAYLRYKEALTGEVVTIPEGLYPGEYLKELGSELADEFSSKLLDMDFEEAINVISVRAVEFNLKKIKEDLSNLAIKHDVFSSEKTLSDANKIKDAVDYLINKNLILDGVLPAPKGEKTDDWHERVQPLFKSTEFGDDQDRAILKQDGSYTYFAGDIGYAYDKIQRGFIRNIIVLGADHAGYVKRMQAIYNSLSDGNSYAEIKLCQLVNFIENGQPVKMSKRAGSFTTVNDVINELGADIIRFMMLTRKNDIILDFDLDLAKDHSKDNPVFYVQYAQVRANSVLENCKLNFAEAYEIFNSKNYNLSQLKVEKEISLIKLLAQFPKIIESACISCEVHKLPYYLQNLASEFHSFWNIGKDDEDLRFIIYDNKEVTAARIALVMTVRNIIRIGLGIMGVKYIEKM